MENKVLNVFIENQEGEFVRTASVPFPLETPREIKWNLGEEITTKQAIEQLTKALRGDQEYYSSWQANIAMQFKDEFDNCPIGKYLNESQPDWIKELNLNTSLVHTIANNAAKNFLNLLIKE